VQVQRLEPEVAARLDLDGKAGLVITKVTAGTPAAKAGLRDDDILTELAGQPVKDTRSLQRTVAGLAPGKRIELSVHRDGGPQNIGGYGRGAAPGFRRWHGGFRPRPPGEDRREGHGADRGKGEGIGPSRKKPKAC